MENQHIFKIPMFLFLLLSYICLSFCSKILDKTLLTNVPGNGNYNNNFSLSFPLHYSHHHHHHHSQIKKQSTTTTTTNLEDNKSQKNPQTPSSYAYKSTFKYSMALIISLPIGTPPQSQKMVLDTGSQLSWIQCHDFKTPKPKPPPLSSTTFDPSLSSTFSLLPCNHPLCKPRIPDFTLPTSCDQNRLCHYSYFYADGTFAEGNLVREKITLSNTQTTPPLILGCTRDSSAAEGILGMNLGRLSFASQTRIPKFSYCVPSRRVATKNMPAAVGSFYLGQNPNSGGFKYVELLTFSQGQSQRMPNFDSAAYTVAMEGMRIGGKKLDISREYFRPGPNGAGQTMVDSGTEYTFLVEEAYGKVKEEVLRLVGPGSARWKRGFAYEGALDLCFEGGDVGNIGRLVGDLAFEFGNGVEIVVEKERVFIDAGGGVRCLSIGRSDLLGIASNIIGNYHQQNLWVEFDLVNKRIGFGKDSDCSKTV